MDLTALEKASLQTIKNEFKRLGPVPESLRVGFFNASFIGPWWLRLSAMPSIRLSGLPGWQGKLFLDTYNATNILEINQQQIQRLSMQCIERLSLIDAKQGVVLHYGQAAPIPWRWVVDELRVINDNTFLCMTVVDLPLLRLLSFPFLLRREQ